MGSEALGNSSMDLIVSHNIGHDPAQDDCSGTSRRSAAEQDGKRSDALAALYDRLGFVRLERTCGHYLEAPGTLTIVETRRWFAQNVKHVLGMALDEDDYIPSASLLHPFA